MDGNGRWAKKRGLARTAGHEAGEAALFDVVQGAIQIGVKELSAYAFSTENWRRSPDEVRFLMGFNRDVLRRRRDEMNSMGVKIQWVGRPQKLWGSVINELQDAQELTKKNKVLTLNMCVNYGGRAELVDAVQEIAAEVSKRKLKPDQISEKIIAKHLYSPKMSDVDLFLRSSGEQRTSNFLPWQSVYAEMVFMDVLWPDVDRTTLWKAIEIYAERERRFGKA
jgi:undecaprenyl diphosphate synthase